MSEFTFYLNSILLGIGLAMDAFSVSIANGMSDMKMRKRRMVLIASTFSVFQFIMPLIGYICVHTLISFFEGFQKCVPWIALILLVCIGRNMIVSSIRGEEKNEVKELSFKVLLVQGIATSIDALSVGFTIANYSILEASICSLIIGILTFVICWIGIVIGKTIGSRFENKAGAIGGVILIIIGLEIFVKGVFIG